MEKITELENSIIEKHEELYEYLMNIHKADLMNIHKADTSFMFRVRRMNNQDRLAKGYYFNGNLNYLETSFWDYKDNLHQTPVIRLVYYFTNKNWACELIGRDNEEREAYFRKMANSLTHLGFIKDDRTPIWRKNLGVSEGLEPLKEFIKNSKQDIDTYLKQNKSENIVKNIEDFVFKKDIQRIENVKENKNQKLEKKEAVRFPFALSSLEVNDFQGITSQTIGIGNDALIPLNTQWIILTGENGFGKTSFLRAIAIGLAGDETDELKKDYYKGKPTPTFEVTGYKNGDYYSKSKEDNEVIEDFNKIVAYGVSRFLTNKGSSKTISKRTASLFSDDELLLSVEDKLKFNEKRFNEIRRKLIEIIPNLADIKRIIKPNGDPEIIFIEKDSENQKFEEGVSLEQLGAGYRSIFMMMGDMIIRLSNDLEKSVNDISGVVLIDELDAHLHPKYQYELPKLLSNAFPKVQFIVSTHSPIPLLGLPKKNEKGEKIKSVVFKVNRTANEGITIDRLDDDIDIQKLSANALLTSDIFGFKDIFGREATPDTIESFDSYTKIKAKKGMELLLELKEGFDSFNIKI